MIFERCHENLSRLHLNTEKNRAYYIPYSNAKAAFLGNRNNSDYLNLLSGKDWKLKTFSSFLEIDDSLLYFDADISTWGNTTVPSTLEQEGLYPLNTTDILPFPIDAPFVPKSNPTAIFIKDFNIEELNEEKQTYLIFEGISSSFYLYINGEFVGYNQVSHSISEFNITEYLQKGQNRIAVVNLKWCSGSYLEKNNFSGIFRDVYLLERNKDHIKDITVSYELSDNLNLAEIKINLETQRAIDIFITLFNPEGEKVGTIIPQDDGSASFLIDEPILWSAETPDLYTILIEAEEEFVPIKIGLKKVDFEGEEVRINNIPVSLKGVHYNDFNKNTDSIPSYNKTITALTQMKRNNINCIKTDYPLSPRFYELCDRLGFYVINTFEIFIDNKTEFILNDAKWEAPIIDRALRVLENFKNNTCILSFNIPFDDSYNNINQLMEFIKIKDVNKIFYSNDFINWCDDSKTLYCPIKIEEIDATVGDFRITNLYDFIFLSRLKGKYEITRYGKVIDSGELDILPLAPKDAMDIHIPIKEDLDGICYIRIFFLWESLSESIPYDTEIASKQFMILNNPKFIITPASEEKTSFIGTDSKIRIFGKRFDYEFSKIKGGFTNLIYRGTSLINKPLIPTGLDGLKYYPKEINCQEDGWGLKITVSYFLSKEGEKPEIFGDIVYLIDGDGNIKIQTEQRGTDTPYIYFETYMDSEFLNLEFFGNNMSDITGHHKIKLQTEALECIKTELESHYTNASWFAIFNTNRSGMLITDFNGFDFSPLKIDNIDKTKSLNDITKSIFPSLKFGKMEPAGNFTIKPFSREDNLWKLALYN